MLYGSLGDVNRRTRVTRLQWYRRTYILQSPSMCH